MHTHMATPDSLRRTWRERCGAVPPPSPPEGSSRDGGPERAGSKGIRSCGGGAAWPGCAGCEAAGAPAGAWAGGDCCVFCCSAGAAAASDPAAAAAAAGAAACCAAGCAGCGASAPPNDDARERPPLWLGASCGDEPRAVGVGDGDGARRGPLVCPPACPRALQTHAEGPVRSRSTPAGSREKKVSNGETCDSKDGATAQLEEASGAPKN